MKNEEGRYLFMDVSSCDVSNNTDPKDLDPEDLNKKGTVNYYLAPSPHLKTWKTLVMLF